MGIYRVIPYSIWTRGVEVEIRLSAPLWLPPAPTLHPCLPACLSPHLGLHS